MRAFAINLLRDVLLPLVLGLVAVIAILPFSLLAGALAAVAVGARYQTRAREGQARAAITSAGLSLAILLGVIAFGGMYRPAKTTERLLDTRVELPATTMSLAELAYATSYGRHRFPYMVTYWFADADKSKTVTFAGRRLSMRDFVRAIESQTKLRHRFMHCGNGYTVLRGGDCSFGMSFDNPEFAIPPYPGEVFDVDLYAESAEGG